MWCQSGRWTGKVQMIIFQVFEHLEYSLTIFHFLSTLNIPGGMYVQWPSLVTTTFVGYVPSNFSSALQQCCKWSSFIWPAALPALDNFDFVHYSWKNIQLSLDFHWYFDYRSLSWIQSPSLNSPARVQPFRSHQSPHSSDNWLKVGRDSNAFSNCLIIGCKIFSWTFLQCVFSNVPPKSTLLKQLAQSWERLKCSLLLLSEKNTQNTKETRLRKSWVWWTIWPNRAGASLEVLINLVRSERAEEEDQTICYKNQSISFFYLIVFLLVLLSITTTNL